MKHRTNFGRPLTAARIVTLLLSVALTLTVALAATPKFYDLVTEAIVKKAAVKTISDLKRFGWGDSVYTASYQGRELTYFTHPGLGEDYYEMSKEALKQQVLDAAKAYLSNPENLKTAYRRYKPTVLKAVLEQKASKPAKEEMKRILVIFRGKLPAAPKPGFKAELARKHRLFEEYLACERKNKYTSCEKLRIRAIDAEENLSTKFNLEDVDLNLYFWIERRRAEGGDALVRAWIEIGEDFLNSL